MAGAEQYVLGGGECHGSTYKLLNECNFFWNKKWRHCISTVLIAGKECASPKDLPTGLSLPMHTLNLKAEAQPPINHHIPAQSCLSTIRLVMNAALGFNLFLPVHPVDPFPAGDAPGG